VKITRWLISSVLGLAQAQPVPTPIGIEIYKITTNPSTFAVDIDIVNSGPAAVTAFGIEITTQFSDGSSKTQTTSADMTPLLVNELMFAKNPGVKFVGPPAWNNSFKPGEHYHHGALASRSASNLKVVGVTAGITHALFADKSATGDAAAIREWRNLWKSKIIAIRTWLPELQSTDISTLPALVLRLDQVEGKLRNDPDLVHVGFLRQEIAEAAKRTGELPPDAAAPYWNLMVVQRLAATAEFLNTQIP
jgi:hypothetical protein